MAKNSNSEKATQEGLSNLQPAETSPSRFPDVEERHRLPSDEELYNSDFEARWSGVNDPDNPRNWPRSRKVLTVATISFITFLTPLASSMFAPGVPDVLEDFNEQSPVLATFVVSIYVLGFAFGPLVFAPMSEIYGRNPVYHTCNVLFLVFTTLSALSVTMSMLIAFRFLSGFAGVGAITVGSGTIADTVAPERRGLAMALWSLGPLFGPIIGPVAGGFLVEAAGWRWVSWLIVIVAGVVTAFCVLFLRETYAPRILHQKAQRRRKETANPQWHAEAESKDLQHLLVKSFVRPLRILVCSSVASFMCIYVAILYGLLYILFTTFTFVFEDQYGFSASSAGLAYLGSGVGTLLGLLYAASLADRKVQKRLREKQKAEPEDRLPQYLVLPGVLFVPVGFFIYGWGAHFQVHWMVPQVGTAITGAGVIIILMCIQTYLVDVYTIHAASAIAASTVLRSMLGALLPLCGLDIYDALGLGWGNTLFGLIALSVAPIPILFGMYGGKLRKRYGLQV